MSVYPCVADPIRIRLAVAEKKDYG